MRFAPVFRPDLILAKMITTLHTTLARARPAASLTAHPVQHVVHPSLHTPDRPRRSQAPHPLSTRPSATSPAQGDGAAEGGRDGTASAAASGESFVWTQRECMCELTPAWLVHVHVLPARPVKGAFLTPIGKPAAPAVHVATSGHTKKIGPGEVGGGARPRPGRLAGQAHNQGPSVCGGHHEKTLASSAGRRPSFPLLLATSTSHTIPRSFPNHSFFSGRTPSPFRPATPTRTLLPGILPVLPFPPSEALTPGAALTLHLYEARYLALLDAALSRPDRCFAHAVIGIGPGSRSAGARGGSTGEALGGPGGGAVSERAAGAAPTASPPQPSALPGGPPPLPLGGDGRAALRCAVLARITSVQPAPGGGPGAIVTVRGEARLALTDLVGVSPFLAATAALALDEPPPDAAAAARLAAAGQAVEALMWDAINLTFKLPRQVMGGGVSGGAASLQAALNWVDHAQPADEGGEAPPSSPSPAMPVEWRLTPPPPGGATPGSAPATLALAAERGARLAFAALQDVPHSSPAARGALARARVAALQTDDTAARLEVSAAVLRATRSALAAKAALHALALE